MQLVKARNIGFCGGVKRAFEMVEGKFANNKVEGKIFVLGSLAHNRGVEKRVKEMGIEKISNLRKVKKGDIVVITAHGAPKEIYEKIKGKGAKVFDTTCPNVIRVQHLAKKYQEENRQVIIFGDKDHKEVKGILGHCRGGSVVISDPKETEKITNRLKKDKKFFQSWVLVSQTTKNIELFRETSKRLKKTVKDLGIKISIIDTICRSSHIRQNETKRLAKKCQLSVVVGGGESANTKRLWQIAKKVNGPVFWIKEVKDNLPSGLIKAIKKLDKKSKVCLISGASTPPWEIEQVEKMIRAVDVFGKSC